MRLGIAVLALLLVGGCNIFSPFYDEGKSDDLDDIKGDVEAALERGEPDKALEYAQRGIEKFPESATLYYLGSVAKVQSAGFGFAEFADMLRGLDVDDGGGGLAGRRPPLFASPAAGDTTWLLDVSPEDLARMADAFGVTRQYLASALDLIEQGKASRQEVQDLRGDSRLGLGVSGVLVAVLTVLDTDHDLSNGFTLHPSIRAFTTPEGGWGFTAAADAAIVCPVMPLLGEARDALYQHYREVVGGDLPETIPAGDLTRPVDQWTDIEIDTGDLPGDFLATVHDGILSLDAKYGCSEVSRHE